MENEIDNVLVKKTKKEQVIEMYIAGERNSKEIAKILGIAEGTVNVYLSQARRDGKIKKVKTKKEQAIEIYNAGERNSKEIAKILGIAKGTVNVYLSQARRDGEIEKIKTKKEQVIEMYYLGEKNKSIIAEKVFTTLGVVNTYLYEIRKEGKVEKIKNKKEKAIEMYISGKRDIKAIAEKIGTTEGTVYTYISQARREGKIDKKITKKEQDKEYKISKENIESEREEKVAVNRERKEVVMPEIDPKEKEKVPLVIEEGNPTYERLKNKVMIFLETKYPREIAEELGVPSRIVYDIIDNLDRDFRQKLKVKKVKDNPLYSDIVELRRTKKLNMEKALYVLAKTELSVKDKLNLAKIYYILGNEKLPERLLNEIISSEVASSAIIREAKEERNNILLEIKSTKIRHDYKNGRNMDGSNLSFDDLCKKYNVRTGFLIDLIGREEIERSR